MSDKTKYTRVGCQDNNTIPYIDDNQDKLHNASETTSCINSSCESLPTQAPLVQQPRCSIDIVDTTSINGLKQGAPVARKKGICEHQNPYLDNMPLRESVQELP